MSKQNEVLTRLELRCELDNIRDGITVYGFLEYLRLINRFTLPGLAQICNKSFTFFKQVEKLGKLHKLNFNEIDVVIDIFRGLKAMVNELQELDEEDSLIMRLPNSDLEVNIMALITLLQGLENKEHISYYLIWGQPMIMEVIDKVDVQDAKDVYDFIEDIKGFLSCI